MLSKTWIYKVFAVIGLIGLSAGQVGGESGRAPADANEVVPASAPGWYIDRADSYKEFINLSEHGIAVDIYGDPHLAYGGDRLYYAYRDQYGWQFEVVDAWGVGSGAAIALDSSNQPHISYIDLSGDHLKYAVKKGGTWNIQTADTWNGIDSTSIDISSTNYPYIVYHSNSDHSLRIITRGDVSWSVPETFGDISTNLGPIPFTLVLDSTNKPHVSFYDYISNTQGDLAYAVREGGTWVVDHLTSMPTTGCTGYYCIAGIVNSLAVDSSNHPHLAAFIGGDYNALYYFYNTGSGWTSEWISDISTTPRALSLELDSSNLPYIVFADNDGLWEKHKTTDWTPWVHLEAGDTGWFASLDLDSYNLQYVRYFNKTAGELRYTRYTGSSWQAATTIDRVGPDVGKYSSLVVDSLDHPHISYYDVTNHWLRYRHSAGTTWTGEVIDSSGEAAGLSSIATDSVRMPGVAYKTTTGELRYMYRVPFPSVTWVGLANPVDSGLGEDLYQVQRFSLAINDNDLISIAYTKNNVLIWAYYDTGSSSWVKQTVDSGSDLHKVSQTLDDSGAPHLAYVKDDDVWYAYKYRNLWTTELVADISYLSANVAIGMGDGLQPVVAYFAAYNDLVLSYRICLLGNCSWVSYHLPASAEDEFDLEVDASGVAHLVYDNWAIPYGMSYAQRKSGQWQIAFIDGVSFYFYPWIALNSRGRPRISYYDPEVGDLKYAFLSEMVYLPLLRK